MDRRFGENDPTVTPEEKAAERYARESQRKLRKESMFNLEGDDDEEEMQLTHKGQSLGLVGDMSQDDFQEEENEQREEDYEDGEMPQKRKRTMVEDDEGQDEEFVEDDGYPERKKSKHDVMKEVIAKSKFYKHERQKAKEDDEDVREELDRELPNLFSLLKKAPPPSTANGETGLSGQNVEKEYDRRFRQMALDKRSQPTERTKTEEEKAAEEAQKLKTLEEERQRRMRGEEVTDDVYGGKSEEESSDDESIPDDAKAFGLQHVSNQTMTTRPELGGEDEDDFIIDGDLVETRSDVSLEFDDSGEELDAKQSSDSGNDDDDEDLVGGLTLPPADRGVDEKENETLAFTYPCPENHESFLKVIDKIPMEELPTVIRRIRALHHPRLHPDNKYRLGRFAAVLVEHVAYMANGDDHVPPAILENVLRHIHSLAKSHPDMVSQAFRAHLRHMEAGRPLYLVPGDLVILTAIGTIFPTSDHFHAVVTPAQLCLARYLGQGPVNSLTDFVRGAYAASLCLQYQAVSKRFVPEVINYILSALCNLGPAGGMSVSTGSFPLRRPEKPLNAQTIRNEYRKLRFSDVNMSEQSLPPSAVEELKHALISTFIDLLDFASDLWMGKSAYVEIFQPAHEVLRQFRKSASTLSAASSAEGGIQNRLQACLAKIKEHLAQARAARRPLVLHHHRPLAIKTSIPKFEESFNPDRHYDPNRERAEANKLKAEYKRERKGAMRELRKDANFIAREKLREKRERDAEYERKYRRLVAGVQNEEGREANAYEREKRFRQGRS